MTREMYLREGDTVVCDECLPGDGEIVPAHEEIRQRIAWGICDVCGYNAPYAQDGQA